VHIFLEVSSFSLGISGVRRKQMGKRSRKVRMYAASILALINSQGLGKSDISLMSMTAEICFQNGRMIERLPSADPQQAEICSLVVS
jgi:hypothetical protein